MVKKLALGQTGNVLYGHLPLQGQLPNNCSTKPIPESSKVSPQHFCSWFRTHLPNRPSHIHVQCTLPRVLGCQLETKKGEEDTSPAMKRPPDLQVGHKINQARWRLWRGACYRCAQGSMTAQGRHWARAEGKEEGSLRRIPAQQTL